MYGMPMQPALALLGILPPPATGTDVLARLDRASARSTADARIPPRVERIHRNIVTGDITPDLVLAPLGERVEFGQPVLGVELLNCDVTAGERLGAPLPGDPRTATGERASEWGRLANGAAAPAQLDAAVERVDTVRSNVVLQRAHIGVMHLDRNVIALAHAIDQSIGLFGKPTGIEREDRDWQRQASNEVGEDHILGAEAARERRGRMTCCHPLQQYDGIGKLGLAIHGSLAAGVFSVTIAAAVRLRNKGMGWRTVA